MFRNTMAASSVYDSTGKSTLTTYRPLAQRTTEPVNQALIDRALQDNGLDRIGLPETTPGSKGSLLSSICWGLFGKPVQEVYLLRKISDTLTELSRTGRFSTRLFRFRNNKQLVKNFLSKPDIEDNVKYLCDLVSLTFRVKVIICSVQTGSPFLLETIYANKFKQDLRVLELVNGQYEPLVKKGEPLKPLHVPAEPSESKVPKSFIPKDSDDDEDDGDLYMRLDHRSKSESNYEGPYFVQNRVASMQETIQDDPEDSSASRNSGGGRRDSNEHDKGGYKRLESELKLFIDADDDLPEDDYIETQEHEMNDRHHVEPHGKVLVEKKLDYLFNKEVDLNKVYYEAGEPANPHMPTPKPSPTEPPGISSFFSQDIELSLVKEPPGMTDKSLPQSSVNSMALDKIAAFDSMSPMVSSPFNLYGFEAGSQFLFPFNVGQMGFQCNDTSAFPIPPQMIDVPKKKPIILDQTQERFTGKLKFFDEAKGYGFIVKDDDEKDIFCHYDDFCKAGININMLRSVKLGHTLRLSFSCLSYIGRHNKSKKAVDLQFLSIIPNPASLGLPGMSAWFAAGDPIMQ